MKLQGYERLTELGAGQFGTVYSAWQVDFQRQVAIKVLHAVRTSAEDLARFERERRVLGELGTHPNIVTVHAAGTTPDGERYIVMALLEEGALDDRMAKLGRLEVAEVLDMGVRLSGALATAHDAGIIHRDIKPDNILIDAYGEPQLGDFGVARASKQTTALTSKGKFLGTVCYMAPEAFDGVADAATDVWSLAATLHHALSGEACFNRDGLYPTLAAIAKDDPPSLADLGVPAPAEQSIVAGLIRDRARRPADAAAFGRGLQDAQRALGLAVTRMPHRGAPRQRLIPPGQVFDEIEAPPPPPQVAGQQTPSPAPTPGTSTVPTPGLAAVEQARHDWLTGDTAAAESALAGLLDDPDQRIAGRAAVMWADIQAGRGDVDGAIGRLRPLINADAPARERAAAVLARLLAGMGDPDGAAEVLLSVSRWPGEDRGLLLSELAEILQLEGRVDEAFAAIAEAQQLPDGGGHDALLLRGRLLRATGEAQQAEAIARRLRIEGRDPTIRAEATILLAESVERQDPDEAERLLEEVASTVDAPEAQSIALLLLQSILRDSGRAEDAYAASRRLAELAHPVAAPIGAVMEAIEQAGRGDMAAAEGWLARATELGGHPLNRSVITFGRATLAALRGETGLVESLLDTVLAAYAVDHGAALQAVAAEMLADLGDGAKARGLLRRFIARGSPEYMADAGFVLGGLLERENRLEEARDAYIASLQVGHPVGSRRSQVALGRLALARGDLDEAQSYLRRAVAAKDYVHSPEAALSLADVMRAKGRHAQAWALLEDAAAARPPAVSSFALMAMALQKVDDGDDQEAAALFDRAVERAEGDQYAAIAALRARAEFDTVRGRAGAAREAYLRAARFATFGEREHLLLDSAYTYVDDGDDRAAIGALEQLLTHAEDDAVRDHAELEIIYAQGRLGIKTPAMRRRMEELALSDSAAATSAVIGLSERAVQAGEWDAALRWWARWRELNPYDTEPHRREALGWLDRGQPDRAVAVLEGALEIADPVWRPATLVLLGDAYTSAGVPPQAARCWEEAADSGDPEWASVAADRLAGRG